MIRKKDFYDKYDFFKKNLSSKSILIEGDLNYVAHPFITIAIPTYKRPELLMKALKSAINQKIVDFPYEIIVVDNEINLDESNISENQKVVVSLSDNRLIYYQNEQNLGMIGNWNRCVELARGKWIAFLHDDDLLVFDYLFKIKDLITRKRNIGCIIPSFYDFFGYEDDAIFESNKNSNNSFIVNTKNNYEFENRLMRIRRIDNLLWSSNPYKAPTCGTIFNIKSLLEIGGFDDRFFPSSDWFFLYKFGLNYKIYKSFFYSGYYRWLDNESIKEKTLHDFVLNRQKFRNYSQKTSFLGLIMYILFRNEQHALYVKYIINIKPNLNMKVNDFDYISKYKNIGIKIFIYNFIYSLYWRIKRLNAYLFG